MTTALVVVGAGGFGREVVEIVRAINTLAPTWDLLGVLDDGPSGLALADLHRRRIAHLGPVDALADLPPDVAAVIGIGSPDLRRRIVAAHKSRQWATLVHPDTTVGGDVTIGAGTVIAPGARLSTNISLGEHVQVDQNVTIGHDSRIASFARLNPQACISGSVTIGSDSLVGASATVLQGMTVGSGATVGAGAVVVRDVSELATVKGVPAV